MVTGTELLACSVLRRKASFADPEEASTVRSFLPVEGKAGVGAPCIITAPVPAVDSRLESFAGGSNFH